MVYFPVCLQLNNISIGTLLCACTDKNWRDSSIKTDSLFSLYVVALFVIIAFGIVFKKDIVHFVVAFIQAVSQLYFNSPFRILSLLLSTLGLVS